MNRPRRRTNQTVTIDDVARQAGVSAMTVSRVMNDDSGVRQVTRDKVLKAVAALNYQPNKSARRLAKGGDVHIGLIYSNPSDNYLGRFLQGALGASQKSDSHLILDICNEDDPTAYVASAMRLAKANVAGVILPPPISGSEEVLSLLAEMNIPIATVGNGAGAAENEIGIDDNEAARRLTRHLIDLGHKRIAFIRGASGQAYSAAREQGFRAEMAAAGFGVDEECVVQGQFTYSSGVEAAQALLDLTSPPTAIFASNDDMAAAAIGVAHRHGLRVPDDLSVVGFDNSASALSVWPELTTIDQPVSAMAAAAYDLLVNAITDKPGESEVTAKFGPEDCPLIIRQSSGPAPI